MTVKLKDIIDALEMTGDASEAFLNMRTGVIDWIGEYVDEEDQEEVSDRLDEDGFVRLPTQYDIHEYSIMHHIEASVVSDPAWRKRKLYGPLLETLENRRTRIAGRIIESDTYARQCQD